MAGFRERVEALGYQVGDRSKHGNFEAAGLTRNALMAFSTRRQQILAKVAEKRSRITSDRGIAVMETRDTKLVNQQTFLVTVTRLRDALTLVVDRASKLERQLSRNAGGKSSALETTGNVRDGRQATGERSRQNDLPVPPEKSIEADQRWTKPYEIGI